MLDSVKIQRRQSEIRQELASLVAKAEPSEDETRAMETLDGEYRQNETRYRAALVAEDEERKEAGAELETRSDREKAELIDQFEVRQIALALAEGAQLSGATNEIVTEIRGQGGYQGLPIPWAALETRAGETLASGTPDPIQTRPIIDRLFPGSVTARMGGQMISVDSGAIEWPVVTSAVTAGWQTSETGDVVPPSAFVTTDRAMKPDNTLGVQMKITRKTLKQSGSALEQAVRRDMNGAMSQAMDAAAFLGTGADGQPLGIVTGAATYGIAETAFENSGSMYANFRSAIVRFMTGNAASSPSDVRVLNRPETWDKMDDAFITGTAVTEWDRLVSKVGAVHLTNNGLAEPTGDPSTVSALLTTSAGGVAPLFVGAWGAVDVIRDPYSDAASGGLRLTALATMDVTVARPAQLELLTGLRLAAS